MDPQQYPTMTPEQEAAALAYVNWLIVLERRGDPDPAAAARRHIEQANALYDTYAAVFRQRGKTERDAERFLCDFLAGVRAAPQPLDWPALTAGLDRRLEAALGPA